MCQSSICLPRGQCAADSDTGSGLDTRLLLSNDTADRLERSGQSDKGQCRMITSSVGGGAAGTILSHANR